MICYVKRRVENMRLAIVFILLQASILVGQDVKPAGCAKEPGLGTGWYAGVVWERIEPPGFRGGRIVITINLDPQSKLLLIAKDGRFELWRGTLSQNIYGLVNDLDKACRLPLNPALAVSLVEVDWKSLEITPAEFAALHGDLTAGLSRSISAAQSRYGPELRGGGRMVLHAKQYTILYDNSGYEHFEFRVDDYAPDDNPLVNWVHRVETLSEKAK